MERMNRFQRFLQIVEAQDPSAKAIVFERNGSLVSLSFGEVLKRVRETNVPKGNNLGIFCSGDLNTLLAILKASDLGKTITLFNPMDEEGVLKEQLIASGVDALIGPEEVVEAFGPLLSKTKKNDLGGKILFFTSGTTSSAKAVILDQARLCSSAYNGASLLPLEPKDELLCALPLSHVFGFVCSWLWAWECGASIALSRGLRSLFSDFQFFKPTAVSLVPQMAAFLTAKRLFNPELRLILIGAGPCDDVVLQGIRSMGIRLSYGYGLSETSSGVALSLGDDPRAFSIVPDDEVKLAEDGEILVKAPSTVFEGYLNHPEDTAASFDEDGYLKTGDFGEFDERGLLHLKGRKKDMLALDDGTKMFLPEHEAKLRALLGLEDIALLQDASHHVVLAVGKGVPSQEIEEKVERYNDGLSRGQKIVSVKYLEGPLPRNSAGKIKRYQIKLPE